MGIALRLYALALVPILFVLAGAGIVIRQANRQAQEATLVGRSIPELAARQSLLAALLPEAGATELDMRTAALDGALRKMVQKIATLASVPEAQGNVNDALAAIGARDPRLAGRYRADVAAARAFAKRPGTSAEMSMWKYSALQRGVLDDLINSNNDLISQIAGLGSYSKVSSRLQTLNTLGVALFNRESEFDTLGQLMLGSALPRPALIANLGRTSALYEQASQQLLHSTDPQAAASWAALINNPATTRIDTLFARLMNRDDMNPAILFESAMPVAKASTLLVETTVDVSSQERSHLLSLSASVKASAVKTLRLTLLGALLLLAMSFLFALRVTRSIRAPLADLESGARSANSDGAQVKAIVPRGPRETRTVISSFNDLLANLRLVEAKSQALAALDLTNPALEARLPGRIGSALDASMRALSDSVAERTKLAAQLAYDAEHDALTGLASRQLALNRLGVSLLGHRQAGSQLAVLFIDLDGFKLVNDTHGHRTGDQLLVRVAELITALVGGDGTVARLGGDEFLVLAENCNAKSALSLGNAIVQALTQSLELATVTASVGASVGVALSDLGTGSPMDLVGQADLALYRAKRDGRGRVQLFDESMQREARDRVDRESALRATLERGGDELQLHFQGMVNGAGHTEAVEALVRWARPGLGLLLPEQFLPLAEATDLVIDVDCWVLSAAIRQAAAWRRDPRSPDLILSVNVAGRHLLSGQLASNVQRALAETGLSPRSLIIEVTEAVLSANAEVAARELAALRATGVRIAVDNFGTDAASVSILRALPLDVLKIDRSLVENAHNPSGRDLLGVLSNLGHVLGLTVIAIGVETQEEYEAARTRGADLIQGQLITRPVPATQFSAILAAGATSRTAPSRLTQRQAHETLSTPVSQV
jgi:diguanylate cyclase (GGDEF)-like protein